MKFDGIKVFSATKARDRDALGDDLTEWLRRHRELEVAEVVVRQSSDSEFHCLSLVVFYRRRAR
jgi:hypothetical protein